jgi:hypothetical protein
MCRPLIYLLSFAYLLGFFSTSASQAELVGWWRFNEGSGETANDSSGNEHHGTLLGSPQWGVGPDGFGSALEFGPEKCIGVDCGVFDPTNGTGEFSITLWALWDGTGTFQHFVTKSAGWGAETMMFQYELWGAHTTATYTDRVGVSYQGAGSVAFSIMPTNEWVHLALTFDGTNATIYLNGVDEEGPKAFSIGPDVDAEFEIGYNSNRPEPSERTFHGLLDDVRLYDKPLTADEVQMVMQGGEGFPKAFSPAPADGALYPETWANLSWRAGDFAQSHDVYFGEDFDDVNDGAESTFIGNQTLTFVVVGFPGFAYPDGLVPGTTYYWRVDEVNDAEPNSPWEGDVWSFSIPPKTAYFPQPADGAQSVDVNVELSWTAGFGAKLHTVYFGESFDQVDSATGGKTQGTATYTPGALEMAKTYYWRVDEFDISDTHKGEVWSFTTVGAVSNPSPADGAADVTQMPTLTWTPGVFADTHEVYFGTDEGSPQLQASGNLGEESFEPGQLEWNTTYYWRIDEANDAHPDSPWTGPLWSFSTANFLIIDDFESYNDINEGEPGSNRIYLAWVDGFDDPTNGSLVGYENPPFAEQSIVHGGNQSMPMSYDNSVGRSEATLTLTDNRDWTVNGVSTVTIWFRGAAANAAETLYAALNGSARVDHDNPDAATSTSWKAWNIDLQAFAEQGVNLSNVNSITLGLDSVTGGTGTMYFDDIRLYAP